MPAWGRSGYTKSAIVRNPPVLPIPMYSGNLSWGVNFQGFPSASLDYTNIAESDLADFEVQYNHRRNGQIRNIEVSFYGLDFKVDSYSYNRQKIIYRDAEKINIYSVSVGLKSKWEDKINTDVKVFKVVSVGSLSVTVGEIAGYLNIPYLGPTISIPIPENADKDYSLNLQSAINDYALIKGCYASFSRGIEVLSVDGGGDNWNFSDHEIITDGRNTLQSAVGYKEVELSWNSGKNIDETTEKNNSPVRFTLEQPTIEELEEYSEDYDKPPEETEVLWDLSSTHDNSGPKKTRRKIISINGNPSSEETWVYGLEYLASDIATNDGQLFSDEPGSYWRLIEYQKTDYIYQKIAGLTLNIQAKDSNPIYANTSLSGYINLVVHPDYEQFAATTIVGGQGTFSSETEYLTELKTKGWRRFRFEKETNENLISLYSDDPKYPYVQYQTLPTDSGTAYSLVTSRTLYGSEVNNSLPFSVEWKKYGELEARIKEKIDSNSQIASNLKVGILYPDPNYVEPMSIETETRYTSSFAYTPNPESSEDDPKPPYMTGEETYYRVDRKKMSETKYTKYLEKNSEFSTQNAGFSDLVEKVTYKEISGRFPEATTRKRQWQKVDGDKNSVNNSTKKYRYFLNSDNNKYIPSGGTKSYDGAKTQAEALVAAKTELMIEGANKDQCQQTLFSFYPNLQDGDRVTLESNRFGSMGDWRIISASWNLEFRGISSKYGLVPICQAQPTSLTLGLFQNRAVTLEKKEAPDDSKTGDSSDPKLIVTGGQTQFLGKVIPKSPNRRRFNV